MKNGLKKFSLSHHQVFHPKLQIKVKIVILKQNSVTSSFFESSLMRRNPTKSSSTFLRRGKKEKEDSNSDSFICYQKESRRRRGFPDSTWRSGRIVAMTVAWFLFLFRSTLNQPSLLLRSIDKVSLYLWCLKCQVWIGYFLKQWLILKSLRCS